ncbi:hypothetical protein KA005_26145 [bacterium]|nr:hypothetical protein [bacterium]
MIGIEIITGRLEASFGPRLEAFFNEHPDAETLGIKMRGIEGGKGMVAILKYDKKEAPKPKPKKPEKTPEQLEKEAKKAQLEKLKAELEEEV